MSNNNNANNNTSSIPTPTTTTSTAATVATTTTKPNQFQWVLDRAAAMCEATLLQERRSHGALPPARALSPLEPPLTAAEYDMMERDQAKYLLYWTAIGEVFKQFRTTTSRTTNSTPIKILIIGPGLGRLVSMCLEASLDMGMRVEVHAFDANPLCTEFLRRRFAHDKNVTVHDTTALLPWTITSMLPESLQPHVKTFDLIVSELIGSFADNEFMPELLANACKLFPRPEEGRCIPERWTTYLAPASCADTYKYIQMLKRPMAQNYVIDELGLQLLSPAAIVYEGDAHTLHESYGGEVEFRFGENKSNEEQAIKMLSELSVSSEDNEKTKFLHGFVGYFTCELSPGIIIDSRHFVPSRNCFHWEAFFFPLEKPIPVDSISGLSIGCRIRRCTQRTEDEMKMWYEWQMFSGKQWTGPNLNERGEHHSVVLR